MSCNTGYLIREPDGSIRYSWEKYGWWLLEQVPGPDDFRIRDQPRRAGEALDWYGCRGVGVDHVRRRYTFFACSAPQPSGGWLESTRQRLAALPAWQGWQVEVAWGGPLDLLDVRFAEGDEPPPAAEPRPVDQSQTLAGWDPGGDTLHLYYDAANEDSTALVSVIGEDLRVLDYRLVRGLTGERGDDLVWLADREALLAVLARTAPFDAGTERDVGEGALIDLPARRLRYWATRTDRRLLDAIARSWAGWQPEWLPYGFAAQLAGTGRAGYDWLTPDQQLLDEGFEPQWVAARRALPADPRPLRPIQVVWGRLPGQPAR